MLSGIGLDGQRFFYRNPLRRYGPEVPRDAKDTFIRWPNEQNPVGFNGFCCPPNVVRTIAKLHGWAYGVSTEGVWVHLYGGNVLETELPDGSALKLTQRTDYPWDGKIAITVDRAGDKPLTLFLRIPGWVEQAALKVNGKPVDMPLTPGQYVPVRRTWSPGDVVELDLPMDVRLIEAHPLVEAVRGQIAVMRGPVVYCLESLDLPDGVHFDQVAIPANAQWTVYSNKEFLDGIPTLKGNARVFERGNWTNRLYRRIDSTAGRTIELSLIPYYAWANRAQSEMTVWLPVIR